MHNKALQFKPYGRKGDNGGQPWVGWRVVEMVGRRGVGVCNTQPQPRYYVALVTPASLCYGSDLRLCYVSPAIETWSPGSRDSGDVFSWGISKINQANQLFLPPGGGG